MTRTRLFLFAGIVCLLPFLTHAQQQPVLQATYQGILPGDFLTRWLVVGPLPVFDKSTNRGDQAVQREVFEAAQIDPVSLKEGFEKQPVSYAGAAFPWKSYVSPQHSIDLAAAFGDSNYAVAYAWARVDMPDTLSTLLGIGSDDGVKVWLNGRQVHSNWVGRPLRDDDDVVPVTFRKGPNDLLVKVQNMEQGWAFSVHRIGPHQLSERLVDAAFRGNLDAIRLLLGHGAPVNARNTTGLTALQAARITGRDETANLLLANGADAKLPMPKPEALTDSLMSSIYRPDEPGAAVLVSRNGTIIYEKAFGLANVEKHVPITPHTRFRIGSITKQFVAACILKLQEEGKLSVRDPLAKYIPDFPRGSEVTLAHLLTHTSGIHSYTDEPDFVAKVIKPVDPESLVATIKTYPFDFNPGERWQYSNSGYFLLGYIVGKVSGVSYGEFLRQNFFIPLRMTETGVHTRGASIPDEATGYADRNDSVVTALDWDMSWAGGAGALYSSVGDLCWWNEGIFGGSVLQDSSLRAAWSPVKLKDGSVAPAMGSGYGYGWVIGKQRGLDVISHGGGLHGFLSALSRYPKEKVNVVVLSNTMRADPSTLGSLIAQYFMHADMAEQESFSSAAVDPKTFGDYVGRYDYPMGAVLSVTQEGEKLFAQLTGQSRFEIFPRKRDEFFWKVVDAQGSFVRDPKGSVVAAIHSQGGNTFRAPRMAEERPASVDPGVFAAYAGEYQIAPGAVLTVTKEGDRLFVQMTGQPKFEIFPRSETEYFLTAVNASVVFKKAPAGTVGGLTLKQAGREMEAKKTK